MGYEWWVGLWAAGVGFKTHPYSHSRPTTHNSLQSLIWSRMLIYRIRLYLIIICLLTIIPTIAIAGTNDVSLRAYADKRSALIGDRIKYVIELKSGGDLKISLPKFPEYKIGEFEIKDSGSYVKKGLFGNRVFYNWYYISSYTDGKEVIPQVEVKYKSKNGNWQAKKTDKIPVTIESVLPKNRVPNDIKDIKGPIYLYQVNWALIVAIVSIIGILILLFIIYRKIIKRRPVRLPHETALEELEAIRGFLAKAGDVKEYYVRVSDCIRHYIERAFALKAPEMTTEEFLNSLRDSASLSPEQKGLLKSFLNACDLVKFAKYLPPSSEIEAVFTAAKKFVEETKDVRV